MQNKNLSVFLFLAVVGLSINVLFALGTYYQNHAQTEKKIFADAANFLESLHDKFTMEIALEKKVNQLFAKVLSLDPQAAMLQFATWKKENYIPEDAAEMVVFKNGEPLLVDQDQLLWELMLATISRSTNRKFRLDGPDRNNLIIFLKGGAGFETIEGKPGIFRRLNRGPERSFGSWQQNEAGTENAIDSAILLVHEGKLPPDFMPRQILQRYQPKSGRIAYVNFFHPEHSVVPADCFSPYDIATLASTFDIKNKTGRYRVADTEILLSARPNGKILIFIPWFSDVAVPVWVLALPFFWLPLLWRQLCSDNGLNMFSLRNLIIVVSLAGIFIPAGLTWVYWKDFLETKKESYKIEWARRLENNLIQIDANHQMVLRQTRDRFRRFYSLLDYQPQNLQKFIDESIRLEVNSMIDALLLVDENGNFLRPYSSCLSTVRSLVFYPRPFRERVIQEHFARGWIPFDLEVDYLLNTEKVDLEKHVGFSQNQGQVVITSLGKMAGKDIISSYNKRKGFTDVDGGEKISSMVMGSFVEGSEENPGEVINQNLGDFVELGFGEYKSRNYVDVIRNEQGRAIYCAIIYGASLLSTHHYFDNMFTGPYRWPDGVNYVCISGLPLRICFPWLDTWRRMESLLGRLQPPRNLLVDEVKINGVEHLRCSYVARKCADYILVAYVPMSRIESEVSSLKNTLFSGAFLLLIILLFVVWRLQQAILVPAEQLMKGVAALEKKDHSYQIKITTDDEWHRLGQTFNSALEGIKELEVAHFIQTCILPAKAQQIGDTVFYGRTIPADDVGGDYYEALEVNDGMTFFMGDVSGHSVSAALVVNMADAAFSALVDQGLHLPQEIFAAMNSLMLEHLRRIKMMTAICGHVDFAGRLTWCNAGQAFPFLISDNGVEILKQVGYPLGAAKKKTFKFETLHLPAQCRLLMFSDGIIEAMNPAGEPFGYERLEALVKKLGWKLDREIFIESVYEELRAFTSGVPWGDDATLVVLDRRAIVNSN